MANLCNKKPSEPRNQKAIFAFVGFIFVETR